MLIGEYKHNLDAKRRLAIPSKFRKELGEGAILTRGLDNCLFLFTKNDWRVFVEKMANLSVGQAKARSFSRMMLMGAMEVTLDKLGRILMPEYLKKFAQIRKNVVVGGVLNRIEIWDEENWQKYKKQSEANVEKIAEEMII